MAKHTFVFCRLRSALSTKLDYDGMYSGGGDDDDDDDDIDDGVRMINNCVVHC